MKFAMKVHAQLKHYSLANHLMPSFSDQDVIFIYNPLKTLLCNLVTCYDLYFHDHIILYNPTAHCLLIKINTKNT